MGLLHFRVMVAAPDFSSSVRPSHAEIAANIAAVRARIDAAATRVGRDPTSVGLIAVSKTVPVERLRDMEIEGLAALGENKVQEGAAKVEALGRPTEWHLVGHLQTNKAKAAVGLFDLIHSVDGVALAAALDKHAGTSGLRQRVLLQVNVAGEESKSGFSPDEVRTAAHRLASFKALRIEGLMTIAPQGADESALRGVFSALRALREELEPAFREDHWRHLSMGMTDDFTIAVEEGATLVRVGRAIFGARPSPGDVEPSTEKAR